MQWRRVIDKQYCPIWQRVPGFGIFTFRYCLCCARGEFVKFEWVRMKGDLSIVTLIWHCLGVVIFNGLPFPVKNCNSVLVTFRIYGYYVYVQYYIKNVKESYCWNKIIFIWIFNEMKFKILLLYKHIILSILYIDNMFCNIVRYIVLNFSYLSTNLNRIETIETLINFHCAYVFS